MAQAYDFALDKIGMEIMSYQVSFILHVFALFGYNEKLSLHYSDSVYFYIDLGGLHQFFERRVSIA